MIRRRVINFMGTSFKQLYSSKGCMLKCQETGQLCPAAFISNEVPYTYIETDILIEDYLNYVIFKVLKIAFQQTN